MDLADKENTAFITLDGLLIFSVTPTGLCAVPVTLEIFMDIDLWGLTWEIFLRYLNDVRIYLQAFDKHNPHLDVM